MLPGDIIRMIPTSDQHATFDVSRDGAYLWLCNRSGSADPLILWNLKSGHVVNCVSEFEIAGEHVEFNQNGSLSLVVGKEGGKGKLIVWKTHSFPPERVFSTTVAEACDATFLNHSYVAFASTPRRLKWRNLRSGAESKTEFPGDILLLHAGSGQLIVCNSG